MMPACCDIVMCGISDINFKRYHPNSPSEVLHFTKSELGRVWKCRTDMIFVLYTAHMETGAG